MNLSKVKIEPAQIVGDDNTGCFGFGVKVSIDGKELAGVKTVTVTMGQEEFPEVVLAMNANVDIAEFNQLLVKAKAGE